MPYKDHEKQLVYQRQWNQNYYKKNKRKERQRIVERKRQIGRWLATYKATLKCARCGEKETVCLEFHHVESQKKEFNIALAYSWGWSKNRIKKEVEKCIVVCANCHRKLHAQEST